MSPLPFPLLSQQVLRWKPAGPSHPKQNRIIVPRSIKRSVQTGCKCKRILYLILKGRIGRACISRVTFQECHQMHTLTMSSVICVTAPLAWPAGSVLSVPSACVGECVHVSHKDPVVWINLGALAALASASTAPLFLFPCCL